MITTESKGLREKLLRWNEIEKLDESSTILVNSNRLYWQLSELMRKEGRQNEVRILTKNIKKIKDERSMYVPMKVEDVISCFGVCSNELPRNTFRASGIKSGKERRNYKNYKNYYNNPTYYICNFFYFAHIQASFIYKFINE